MSIFSDTKILRLHCNQAPESAKVKEFLTLLDFKVDSEFVEFVTHCDGAEGFVSDDNFVQIWSLEDILALNPYYKEIAVCNNLLFFGSDGSNLGFAVDKLTGEFVPADFIDIGTVTPKRIGISFREFLNKL